jgi:hypothetical protein
VSSIGLQSGQNVITATAHDAAGNIGTATITVTYNPLDTTNPSIGITSPANGFSTTNSTVPVSGTASDNVGVTSVTWINNRGGSGTASGTTSWNVSSIGLQSGQNVITATAHDAAGNIGTATITVTYNSSGSPIQWPISSGGNGHYYQLVSTSNQINWTDARDAAIQKGGYLATITSTAENDFVNSLGTTDHRWIGGSRPDPSSAWTWVTGELFSYANWGPGQPDNQGADGPENYLEIMGTTTLWNDFSNTGSGQSIHAYVVEYDTLPASFLQVTSTNSSGPGSLLDTLTAANSTPSVKTITFNLPGSGPWTITTATTLSITAPVVIDGSSQPGYDGQFNRVYVEGAAGVSNVFSLSNHGGTTIKGLGIYNYDNDGVFIGSSADWNFVDDCYIGFKGTLHNTSRAPFSVGVEIRGSYNKVRRTTISGVYNGISIGEPIDQTITGLVSHDNLFEYNRIGTDPTGQTTVGYGNTSTGIFLGAGVQSSWIGGYNVIAGNGGSAVEIRHPSDTGNRIYYNYLGVNDGGTQIIAGSTNNQGILIGNDAKNNGAWGNVVAGNRIAGIIVASGDGNWILGNTIGLNQSQTQAIGSQPSGIVLKIDDERTPGVAAVRNPITGNMICNHSLNGIGMYNAVGNGVYNNWIGMNGVGQFFANTNFGVYLENSSYNLGSGNAWGANGQGNVGQVGGTGNIIN